MALIQNPQSSYMDYEKAIKSENLLSLVKFETLVKDIQRITGYEWNSLGQVGVRFTNKALNIMLGENVHNEYVKIIIENTNLGHINDWNKKYQQFRLEEKSTRKYAAEDLIICCRQHIADAYNFIFWALLVTAVDKYEYDTRIAFISDFAQIMRVTKEEMSDLVYLIRFLCHEVDNNYVFQSERIRANFGDILKVYSK